MAISSVALIVRLMGKTMLDCPLQKKTSPFETLCATTAGPSSPVTVIVPFPPNICSGGDTQDGEV